EIDFVVNRGAKKYYIQSALNMSDESKSKQELRPLLAVNDFFKKIIISKTSMKPWTDEVGVVRMGLYDFLLNEDSLNL
ncbi:MAG: ATP-binding protein, partial [Clostridia bacterium]